jgi:predicted nucleic acid-binding Zn ribbon protein
MTNSVPPDQPGNAARRALRRITGGPPRTSSRPGGLGRSASAPRATDRDPQRVGESLDSLIAERGWQQATTEATLLSQWPHIVGADVAGHVVPETFVDGVLHLRADSTAWATQVGLLMPHLRPVIDSAVGIGVVRDIRIQGPQPPSWKAGPRRVKGRGPRDTYG